jgi:Uma2 family endonuclease
MNVAARKPTMTQDEFFDWAEAQDERYEFDGFQPVAMTGGTANHNRVQRRVSRALENRLAGSRCEPLGPDAGVKTIGDTVRYPDVLVSCTRTPGQARTISGAVVVFEVISRSSARIDRIVKLREYHAVASIRRYVILEQESIGLTVFTRSGDEPWTASVLIEGDTLALPEIGIEIPVAEFYEGILFDEPAAG